MCRSTVVTCSLLSANVDRFAWFLYSPLSETISFWIPHQLYPFRRQFHSVYLLFREFVRVHIRFLLTNASEFSFFCNYILAREESSQRNVNMVTRATNAHIRALFLIKTFLPRKLHLVGRLPENVARSTWLPSSRDPLRFDVRILSRGNKLQCSSEPAQGIMLKSAHCEGTMFTIPLAKSQQLVSVPNNHKKSTFYHKYFLRWIIRFTDYAFLE